VVECGIRRKLASFGEVRKDQWPEQMTDSESDLPIRLGLKPYSEFEQLMFPLFKRVASEERDHILRKIYSLMGEKLVLEKEQKEIEHQRDILREKQASIRATRRHVEKAMEELVAADARFHKDLPRWFEFQPILDVLGELVKFLAENEESMGRVVRTLSDPEGMVVATQLVGKEITTTVSLISPPMKTPFDLASPDRFEFEHPDQRKTTIDDPFIECVVDCLPPKARGGKRSRFGRDAILEKVFEFMGQRSTRSRFTKARARKNKQQKN
jgi:hypothetical protein